MASRNDAALGIDIEDLRQDVRRGIKKAAELEFRAVELSATQGQAAPDTLGASGRRDLARFADSLGIKLSALTADMPALRITHPTTVEERIDRTTRILDLARDLGVPVVTTGFGALTDPQSGKPSELAIEALGRIGEYADARGVCLAIRPSYDAGERWTAVLDALRCPSIRVGLDPAEVVMTGANPLAAIERFIEQVSLFHARDATAGFSDPHGGEPRLGHETALGEGDVDLVGVIEVLREAEYRGPYILRRKSAEDPVRALVTARDTLRRLL